jgi:hypothetical protein
VLKAHLEHQNFNTKSRADHLINSGYYCEKPSTRKIRIINKSLLTSGFYQLFPDFHHRPKERIFKIRMYKVPLLAIICAMGLT